MGRHKTVTLRPISLVILGLLCKDLLVGFDLGEDFVALPLCPQEVVVAPVVEVAHGPPEAGLEGRPDQDGVVAPSNVVLVGREG